MGYYMRVLTDDSSHKVEIMPLMIPALLKEFKEKGWAWVRTIDDELIRVNGLTVFAFEEGEDDLV